MIYNNKNKLIINNRNKDIIYNNNQNNWKNRNKTYIKIIKMNQIELRKIMRKIFKILNNRILN